MVRCKLKLVLMLVALLLVSSSVAYGQVTKRPSTAKIQEYPVVYNYNATEYALAILTNSSKATLVNATYSGTLPQILVTSDPRQQFPKDGLTYLIMSSGIAEEVLEGNATHFISTNMGGIHLSENPVYPEYDAYDVAILNVSLKVPESAHTLSFYWQFGTEEIPTYINSSYMDFFVAKMITPDGKVVNLTVLPNGKMPSVDTILDYVNIPNGSSGYPLPPYPVPNDVALNAMTTANKDKSLPFTPFLSIVNVTPYRGKVIKITFEVGDSSDGVLDSAAFIDKLGFDSVAAPAELQLVGNLTYEKINDSCVVLWANIYNPSDVYVTDTFSSYVGAKFANGTTLYTIEETKSVTVAPHETKVVPFEVCLIPKTTLVTEYIVGVKRADTPPQSPEGIANKYIILPNSAKSFVHIVSVDPSLFPQIKLSVIVNTTDGLEGKLTQDNFKVYEDGVQQKITDFYFTKTAAKGKVDIAVCFDDTGSMGDNIDAMKKKVDELVNNITATGMDVRWALVTFKDYVTVKLPWTTNSTEFENAVNSLYASGGGDTPEDSLDAIMTALKLGFRPDAEKIVIVITDAPCHYKGDGTEFSNYTMPEVASAIKSAGVLFIAVCPYSGTASVMTDNAGNPVATSLLNATDSDLRLLAESVNGIWLDINSADFSKVLDKIEKIVTGTYIIEYTTTNPALDGTKRTVSVAVNDPVAGYGYATSWYIAPTTLKTCISFSPSSISLAPSGTANVNIVLDNASNFGGADLTITVSNSSVAEITNINFPSWAGLKSNSTLPNSTLHFNELPNVGTSLPTTNLVLATIEIKALKPGTTTLTIKVNGLYDESGNNIASSTTTTSATITVMAGPPPIDGKTPKDLNGDGLYEDVNGDGVFNFGDVVFFFYHLSEIEKNPAYVKYLDFNKDGTVNFGDVVKLFYTLSAMY